MRTKIRAELGRAGMGGGTNGLWMGYPAILPRSPSQAQPAAIHGIGLRIALLAVAKPCRQRMQSKKDPRRAHQTRVYEQKEQKQLCVSRDWHRTRNGWRQNKARQTSTHAQRSRVKAGETFRLLDRSEPARFVGRLVARSFEPLTSSLGEGASPLQNTIDTPLHRARRRV